MSDRHLLALVGPTGAGKSEVALELAACAGFEIVAVDSRVVYRGLDIGTAKPGPAARSRVPHHMLDLVEPTETFDAMRYAAEARVAIDAIRARGREPLLEGGTGFYLRALVEAGFDGPAPDPEFRRTILEEAVAHPPGWLHAELARADAASAARIQPRDTFRLVRALEITRSAGRPASEVRAGLHARANVLPARVVVITRPKPELDRRIAERWEGMIRAGLVEEVRGLAARGLDRGLSSLSTPGYRELFAHLAGELTWRDAGDRAVAATRRYAKRQLTWYRHQAPGATWLEAGPDGTAILARRVREALGQLPP